MSAEAALRLRLIDLQVAKVYDAVRKLVLEVRNMSAELDRLKASVEALKTVEGGVVTLLNSLAQQIRDLKTDPAALAALADDVDKQAKALGDAVAANTNP